MDDSTSPADAPDYAAYLTHPLEHLDRAQRRWLRPLGPVGRVMRWVLFRLNHLLMRLLFRVEAHGIDHLPRTLPYLLCPNHTSSLDPAAIVAVLDARVSHVTRWAGRKGAIWRNPIRHWINRLGGTVPVDRDLTALAVATAVLQQQQILVWFPEGTRTHDGELQEFKPGVGMLLYRHRVPAVPVYIAGAFDSWPPSAKLPRRLTKIVVRFGAPLLPDEFLSTVEGEEHAIDRLVAELRRRVAELGELR